MDSLQDILSKKKFIQPDEIAVVKDYIEKRYKSSSRVRLERDTLIVLVPGSALAATLQLEQQNLIEACKLKKKLIVRNGR